MRSLVAKLAAAVSSHLDTSLTGACCSGQGRRFGALTSHLQGSAEGALLRAVPQGALSSTCQAHLLDYPSQLCHAMVWHAGKLKKKLRPRFVRYHSPEGTAALRAQELRGSTWAQPATVPSPGLARSAVPLVETIKASPEQKATLFSLGSSSGKG